MGRLRTRVCLFALEIWGYGPGLFRDVTALANRAVHGEYVAPDDAREIADVGIRLLHVLPAAAENAPEQPMG